MKISRSLWLVALFGLNLSPTPAYEATQAASTVKITSLDDGRALDANMLEGEHLIEALQKGGYVLFLRHASTDPTQADTDTLHLDNVKAQRQLTDKGRAEAAAIGGALRDVKIPVGRILVSPYARSLDTAKLAKLGEVTPLVDIAEPQNVTPLETKRRAEALRTLLATPPMSGANTLLVSHKPNLQEAAGKDFGDMKEAEMAVFKPVDKSFNKNGYELVARVLPDQWSKYAREYAAEYVEKKN